LVISPDTAIQMEIGVPFLEHVSSLMHALRMFGPALPGQRRRLILGALETVRLVCGVDLSEDVSQMELGSLWCICIAKVTNPSFPLLPLAPLKSNANREPMPIRNY